MMEIRHVFLFLCFSVLQWGTGLATGTFLEAKSEHLPLIHPRVALQLKTGYRSQSGTRHRARHRTRAGRNMDHNPCKHLKEKEARTACELKWDVSLITEKSGEGIPEGVGARTQVSIALEHD